MTVPSPVFTIMASWTTSASGSPIHYEERRPSWESAFWQTVQSLNIMCLKERNCVMHGSYTNWNV